MYMPGDKAGKPKGDIDITQDDVTYEARLMVSVIMNRAVLDKKSLFDEVQTGFGGYRSGQASVNHGFGNAGSDDCERAGYLLDAMNSVLGNGSLRTDLLGWRAMVQGGVAILPPGVVIGVADTNFYSHP